MTQGGDTPNLNSHLDNDNVTLISSPPPPKAKTNRGRFVLLAAAAVAATGTRGYFAASVASHPREDGGEVGDDDADGRRKATLAPPADPENPEKRHLENGADHLGRDYSEEVFEEIEALCAEYGDDADRRGKCWGYHLTGCGAAGVLPIDEAACDALGLFKGEGTGAGAGGGGRRLAQNIFDLSPCADYDGALKVICHAYLACTKDCDTKWRAKWEAHDGGLLLPGEAVATTPDPSWTCFSYFGDPANSDVTQQCNEAGAGCCTGCYACDNFVGTVCQGSCTDSFSCTNAGETYPVLIAPGSCNGVSSCNGIQNTAIGTGSRRNDRSCQFASGVTIGDGMCNTCCECATYDWCRCA